MSRGRALSRGAAWVVAGLLAVGPASDALAGLVGAGPPPGLVVTGDVAGLVPGRPGTLHLTVTNPGTTPSSVSRVDVRVTAVEGSCPRAALRVASWTGHLVVPAGGSVTRDVAVAVDDVPGCEGASWRLAYTTA